MSHSEKLKTYERVLSRANTAKHAIHSRLNIRKMRNCKITCVVHKWNVSRSLMRQMNFSFTSHTSLSHTRQQQHNFRFVNYTPKKLIEKIYTNCVDHPHDFSSLTCAFACVVFSSIFLHFVFTNLNLLDFVLLATMINKSHTAHTKKKSLYAHFRFIFHSREFRRKIVGIQFVCWFSLLTSSSLFTRKLRIDSIDEK